MIVTTRLKIKSRLWVGQIIVIIDWLLGNNGSERLVGNFGTEVTRFCLWNDLILKLKSLKKLTKVARFRRKSQ